MEKGQFTATENAAVCSQLKKAEPTTTGSRRLKAGGTLFEVGGGLMAPLDLAEEPPRSKFCQIAASLANALASPTQRSNIPRDPCGACRATPEDVQAAVIVQT